MTAVGATAARPRRAARRRPRDALALPVRPALAVLLSSALLCTALSAWWTHVHHPRDGREARGRAREDGPPDAGRDGAAPPRPRHRVYCMVPFIWTPSALPTYRAIRATWGRRCHVLRFFVDPLVGDATAGFHDATDAAGAAAARDVGVGLPDDVVVLGGMRRPWHAGCGAEDDAARLAEFGNCRNIWEKIWRMVVYVGHGSGGTIVGDGRQTGEDEREADAYTAEWFVKVDADTFLFPDNVGRFVDAQRWSHDDHHYFGHVLHHRKEDRGVSIVAGGAVFLSRATLLAAAAAFAAMPLDRGDEEEDGTCRDAYTGTEEVVTAACLLGAAGVAAAPALDPEGREHVALYAVDDLLGYNRTAQGEWWFWEGKARVPCHDAGDCLARLPLAFHGYKDPRDLLDLERELYGGTEDGGAAARRWPNFDMTQRYFKRVRAAMKEADAKESRSVATLNGQLP